MSVTKTSRLALNLLGVGDHRATDHHASRYTTLVARDIVMFASRTALSDSDHANTESAIHLTAMAAPSSTHEVFEGRLREEVELRVVDTRTVSV